MHLDGCVEGEAAYYGAPPGWIGRALKVQSTRCTFVCSIPTADNCCASTSGKSAAGIVGIYTDASGNGHGFLFSNGVYTSFDYPKPPSLRQQGLTLAASSWGSMLTPRAPCTDLCGRRKR